MRSRTMPRDNPQSLSCGRGLRCLIMPFSTTSCDGDLPFPFSCMVPLLEAVEEIDSPGSMMTEGNSMLPTKHLIKILSMLECLLANLEAASTVTVLHLGGSSLDTNDSSGVQCKVVFGAGSGGGGDNDDAG